VSPFTGTLPLVALALRRDRWQLPLWVLGIGGVTYATGVSEARVYETQASIDAYAELVGGSPVTIAFGGPPVGLHTMAGIIVYEAAFMMILGVCLMAITMTVRHTRAEEESGRSEVVRATEVGRHAASAAALVATTVACLLVGFSVWLALAPSALTSEAALVLGAGIAVLGLVHAAIALCLAQLFTHSRTAVGAALAVFAVAYVVRAAGDVRGDWLVWLSPIGWVQASHVPAENRWWPLAVPLLATAALLALAVWLAERRDLGAGMLPTRPAPDRARPSLSGAFGLAWRMKRGGVLGWSTAVLLLGSLVGTLGDAMADMAHDNPTLADYLALDSGATVTESYLATMVLILGLTVGAFAVWSAGHPGAGEDEGQLDLVLAGPTSRSRSLVDGVLATVAGSCVVLVAAATGLAVGQLFATDAVDALTAFGAQLAYLPAVLVLVGIVVLLDGWLPRWTWLAWAVVAVAVVIGWLGGLLDPPQWMVDLSPFSHVPRVPVEDVSAGALSALVLVAVGLAGAGLLGFRRRDVGSH
jgi:ABC-2 type transport system permease protein